MQQYFIPQDQLTTTVTITDKDSFKHMFTVMRLKADDEVTLVAQDGQKGRYCVTNPEEGQLDLLEPLDQNNELPVAVTIACGFSKGDKLDLISQKATELGASAIWGFPGDWSVVKWDSKKLAKRQDKFSKIALGAAQQSKRNQVPQVRLFDQKKDFLSSLSDFDQVLVAYEESAKEGESSQLAQTLEQVQAGQQILLIFGPEGGLSPKEIQAFQDQGAKLIGLGPRILRAETAPLYALSAISYALELHEN
ncbi:16S rRNA (uracil(1498)-N(3))-methyltransferase [Streptococcus sp. DD12]|uniref:16S rRNA (uracil(1498)-N(3))-methyltransferase n=1 Tax=Streptococcus sp. DD12 TaxID=1777880 RepID=UPI0007942FF2|nr:16S rRNA (uracil(1498)-N(3))-methyltransferase [Streptococcus sp. DD12]KXT75994.1 Ribosomal RNA small subunit methyltransferase E [Streptococcus sp. DD12]